MLFCWVCRVGIAALCCDVFPQLTSKSVRRVFLHFKFNRCIRCLNSSVVVHIHLPVCLWIMDPHSRAPKKNTSHGNEMLPQITTHPIQRPCYQQGSPCQDPAGNRTTRRPPDHRKETQTAGVWSCLPFIGSGQTILQGTVKGGKKTRQREEEVGRQHQGTDRPGVRKVPEGSGKQEKIEETGCKVICGAPMTLAV